jgi:hypothetical protein
LLPAELHKNVAVMQACGQQGRSGTMHHWQPVLPAWGWWRVSCSTPCTRRPACRSWSKKCLQHLTGPWRTLEIMVVIHNRCGQPAVHFIAWQYRQLTSTCVRHP